MSLNSARSQETYVWNFFAYAKHVSVCVAVPVSIGGFACARASYARIYFSDFCPHFDIQPFPCLSNISASQCAHHSSSAAPPPPSLSLQSRWLEIVCKHRYRSANSNGITQYEDESAFNHHAQVCTYLYLCVCGASAMVSLWIVQKAKIHLHAFQLRLISSFSIVPLSSSSSPSSSISKLYAHKRCWTPWVSEQKSRALNWKTGFRLFLSF